MVVVGYGSGSSQFFIRIQGNDRYGFHGSGTATSVQIYFKPILNSLRGLTQGRQDVVDFWNLQK